MVNVITNDSINLAIKTILLLSFNRIMENWGPSMAPEEQPVIKKTTVDLQKFCSSLGTRKMPKDAIFTCSNNYM